MNINTTCLYCNMFKQNYLISFAVIICVYLLWTAEHLGGPKDKLKRIWRNRVEWQKENTTMLRSSSQPVTPDEDLTGKKIARVSKPMIAICAATHSKSNWRSLGDTALQNLLIPSIQKTISTSDRSKYDFRLYLAADHDDQFWLNNQNNIKTPDWLSVHVGLYEVPEHKIPFNPMMRTAYNDGAEYMVRINDDSEFVTSDWVSKAADKLASYDPPNVGMVGPNCREGNTAIMTHDMVHRTHFDIFEHYYPDVFSAWWIDDWISKVYGPTRSTKMMDWTVKHHTHEHGTRYEVQHHEKQLLKGELEKGADKIEAWLRDSSKNPKNASTEYHSNNDPLGAFLSKYLAQECLQLDDCESVRNVEGYNLLNAHQQGQAVMTRILKAFSMLFEKLDIKWIPAAGTMLGILRHHGWIPWDGDMDIFMNAEDTHKVAGHLHLLPDDLSMVHPLVDGATMGKGIYKNMCSASHGFGFDPVTGKGVGSLDCSRTNAWKPTGCLYASLRDLNSCRPGTNNIVNGLSVDIFVIPRNEECGDEYFRNALNAPRQFGTFYGWRIPIPMNPHQFLSQNKWHNYGKKEEYMRIIPKWGKYNDPEPNHICPNWRNVIHKQPIVETPEHLFVRQQKKSQLGDDTFETTPKLSKNIISYSLYGSNPRYTDGALANAKLVKEIYPHWIMRVYYDNSVPAEIIRQLKTDGVHLVDMTGSAMNKMSWRFQAAADTERFCARDIDSRLSKREAAAVEEWVQSGKQFHVMRDHPSHSNYPMSGGMWCSTTIPNMEAMLTDVKNQAYLQDMNFLNKVIWPMAQKSLVQHDSFSCDKFGGGKPFPTPRVGWEHVGSVYTNGKMRQGDMDILKRKGVVRKCTVSPYLKSDDDHLVKAVKTLVFPPNFSHSQSGNSVPSYLFNTLMKRANVMGTFVEFGCADGTTHSTTYAFEQMGWKGLCIEPNYHNFLKAKEARTNAIFSLVTGKPGNFTYAQILGKDDQLSGVVEFYSPKYKELVAKAEKRGDVEYLRLPGTPLESLLESRGFTHVDWISVDCEGCEASFIQNFDFTKWGVQIVNYEPNTAARMHTAEIEAALKSHGFVFDRQLQDRIWRKPGPFSPRAYNFRNSPEHVGSVVGKV